MNDKQMDELEDELGFSDDDEFMKEYRAKRLAQMQENAAKPKYGTVREINKTDWEHEVTRAPEDVFVVIVLYQP